MATLGAADDVGVRGIDVAVLGFWKAICKSLPTTDELGETIRSASRLPTKRGCRVPLRLSEIS